jgi:hypothetical protein
MGCVHDGQGIRVLRPYQMVTQMVPLSMPREAIAILDADDRDIRNRPAPESEARGQGPLGGQQGTSVRFSVGRMS